MNTQHIEMTYSNIYTSNMHRSIKWYYKAFGFYALSMNPDFSTMEIMPGRIMFINRAEHTPRKIWFQSNNINALRRQLAAANIPFVEEEQLPGNKVLKVKDPDGNQIEVWSGGFGMEQLRPSVPDHFSRGMRRCQLVQLEEQHMLIKQISIEDDYPDAAENLRTICENKNISITGQTRIVTKCTKEKEDVLYAGIPVYGQSSEELPDGIEYINPQASDYSVFKFDYSRHDVLRSHEKKHMQVFMDCNLFRPDPYYMFEEYREDFIYIYLPYTWYKEGE